MGRTLNGAVPLQEQNGENQVREKWGTHQSLHIGKFMVLMSQKQLVPGNKSHMPAVRSNEVEDTSRNGSVCTFADNRSLAGTAAKNLAKAKSCALSAYILLIKNGLFDLTSP
jgi:hypothetical protein